MLGDRSAKTFKPLWDIVSSWGSYFYVTDGYSNSQASEVWKCAPAEVRGTVPYTSVAREPLYKGYPKFIEDGDQIVSKTYMTRVENENTRLRHYLARLHRKTLCYSKSVDMLKYSIRLRLHYLKYREIPAFI